MTPSHRFERLLLICPHPDDETLAAGILLQNAVALGADVRVVYLTNGESNALPQLAVEKRWPRSKKDRDRWGAIRQDEARAALRTLGVMGEPEFWNLPDQGLAALIAGDGIGVTRRLQELVKSFRPTLIVTPSRRDLHSDHVAAEAIVARVSVPHLVYMVHGAPIPAGEGFTPDHWPELIERKQLALQCHATQLRLSRRRMLELARREERYLPHDLDGSPPSMRRLKRLPPIFLR